MEALHHTERLKRANQITKAGSRLRVRSTSTLRDALTELIQLFIQVQGPTLPREHRNVPAHLAPSVRAFVCAFIARIAIGTRLLPMQQGFGVDRVVDVAGRAPHCVHQARFSIYADVRLHAEVPLLAFLALMHLRITLVTGVLELQAFGMQQRIDRLQDLRCQVVLFQHMTKLKNGALVGQAITLAFKPCELTKQRHVVQCLFHGRIREVEPLSHEVNAQHRLGRKGRAAALAFGQVR